MTRRKPLQTALLALAASALAACSDTEFITAPESGADGTTACATADCTTFRQLDLGALDAPLTSATTIAQTSVRDRAFGAQLAQRLGLLRTDLAAGRQAHARIGLAALLSDLRVAEADATKAVDRPDFAAIRLNLEPLVINLGLR